MNAQKEQGLLSLFFWKSKALASAGGHAKPEIFSLCLAVWRRQNCPGYGYSTEAKPNSLWKKSSAFSMIK